MLQTLEAMRCPHACLPSSLNLLPLHCHGEITSSSCTGWLSEPDSAIKKLQLRIVGGRVTMQWMQTRRIIVGAYDCEDGRLVGTSCSAPITCVSNNDVPKKAPYIPIEIPVASAWPKWHYCAPQV